MTHLRTVAFVLVLLAAACGGGDDEAANNDGVGDGNNTGGGNDPTIMSTDFDLSALPDNFPENLIPPSWDAGQATDLLGPSIVNFESDMEFADLVEYYDGIFGDSNPIVGDPGEQLAQWTGDPTWLGQVLDGDPALISFTDISE